MATDRAVKSEDVRARLWQDPLAAVSRHTREDELDKNHKCRHDLRDLSFGSSKNETTVLGVMIPAGPYDEDAERRLRSRHATLSALGVLGFEPEDSEHLRYFRARELDPFAVPYEWFTKRDGDRRRLLLLWLDNGEFRSEPLSRLADLVTALSQRESPANAFKLVGPWDSTNLRAMAEELQKPAREPNPLAGVQIYSPSATIADALLPGAAEESLDHIFRRWTGDGSSRFLRTLGTDSRLAEALLDELERRGAHCREKGDGRRKAHVALVSEWDTHYGRALPCAFIGSAQGPDRGTSCLDSPGGRGDWIHRFSHLRGLDGQLPASQKTRDEEDETPFQAEAGEDEPVERPVGRSGMDYLRRLAGQLERLDADLRREDDGEEGLQAIGVLGSDVYDKLLVLQALRGRFPHVLFFTTDLDVSLLHPAEYEAARNLIVVSNFGLELNEHLQGNVPAFRDNYQTSLFFSVQLALDPADDKRSQKLIDGWMRPRIFEIARSGAFDLSAEPKAAGMTENAGEWRWDRDASIHPPRVDVLSRPPAIGKGLLVLSLVVIFLAIYARNYRGMRVARAAIAIRSPEHARSSSCSC